MGLDLSDFLYEDHTISSVTRENVAFSLAKILVFTGNLYLDKSLEAFFYFVFQAFPAVLPVQKADNCFLWFIFI